MNTRLGSTLRSTVIGVCVLVHAAGVEVARGQCEANELAKLIASDADWSSLFGGSVSLDGEVAVIGARETRAGDVVRAGAAYVYRSDGAGWVEQAKLTASDAAKCDFFGSSVSISGGWVVVGSYNEGNSGGDQWNGHGSAYVFRFDGSQWVEEAKLMPSDVVASDRFGSSVSISGHVAVVGASNHGHSGASSDGPGAAYVYRFDGSQWVEEAKLVASDASLGDWFGISVSIDGDLAVIGAYKAEGDVAYSGTAYVFRFDGTDWFGWSVSICGDVFVIGAIKHDYIRFGPPDAICGAAYVYRFDGSGWTQEAKLTAFDTPCPWRGTSFGGSVAVRGDLAVIGGIGADCANGSACGAAYVYRFDGTGWVAKAKLTALDGTEEALFGMSVGISNDVALIGAFRDDEGAGDSGSAYIFERNHGGPDNWGQVAKFSNPDPVADDHFGEAVAVGGDVAAIGVQQDDDDGSNSGSAYVYRFNGTTWIEEAKLTASDADTTDFFGRNVSISGDVALFGVLSNDDAGAQSGSAYIFRGLSDCQPNGTIDICDIADGTSQDDNGNGIPDECECPGDIDGDGDTDHSDLGELLSAWCSLEGDPNWNANADLDGDGHVGHGDLGILLADWGCSASP